MGYKTKNQFVRVVKTEMLKKSISLRQLAAESGITPGYLSLVLSGDRNPPQPEVIDRMTSALGLRPPMLHLLAGYIPVKDPRWAKFVQNLQFMSDDQLDKVLAYVDSLPKKRKK